MEDPTPTGAVLFGSISTIADTSELQREAYNEAFTQHGLDWSWDRESYRQMLASSGGKDRVAGYAADQGQDVDAEAVHATKSEIFRDRLTQSPPPLRDGVADTVTRAKDQGLRVGLITTTSRDNVRALLEATAADLGDDAFDLVVDVDDVERPKPDAAAYRYALTYLGVGTSDCVAIEDNVGGVNAATAAGLRCVAFPNQNTAGHEFTDAAAVIDTVDLSALGVRS